MWRATLPAASTMSRRYRCSGRIQDLRFGENLAAQCGLESVLRHKVDRPPEKFREFGLEIDQRKQRHPGVFLENHEKVHVAVRAGFFSRRGSKHCQLADAVPRTKCCQHSLGHPQALRWTHVCLRSAWSAPVTPADDPARIERSFAHIHLYAHVYAHVHSRVRESPGERVSLGPARWPTLLPQRFR